MRLKLRYSPTSPYVRKVSVTLLETGLHDLVERIGTNPWDSQTDLPEDNPLGRVPALVTESGEQIFDSPVICEFLDSLHTGSKIFPQDPELRLKALRLQSLADGVLDAAVSGVIERVRRPEPYRWEGWIDRQLKAIHQSMDWLEARADWLSQRVDIGTISVGCALGYLDFRFASEPWRDDHKNLSAWYDEFSQRSSMRDTVPLD